MSTEDSAYEASHLGHPHQTVDDNINNASAFSKIYEINPARPWGFSNDLVVCTKSSFSSDDPIPRFYISITYFSSKPSLALHSGPTKTSPVLGVAYLKFFSSQNFLGIGDPDPFTGRGKDGKEVIWERLDRVSKFTHRVYGFSFATGLGRENGTGEVRRRRFLWKRMNLSIFGDQGNMELVEDFGGVNGNESGCIDGERSRKKLKHEVLAKYEGVGTFKFLKRGRLMIKEGGGREWEIMVILSIMTLVELQNVVVGC